MPGCKFSAIHNAVADSSEEAASICSNRESSLAELTDQEILKEVSIDHHNWWSTGAVSSLAPTLLCPLVGRGRRHHRGRGHLHCRHVHRWRSTGPDNDQPVGRRHTGGLQGGSLGCHRGLGGGIVA